MEKYTIIVYKIKTLKHLSSKAGKTDSFGMIAIKLILKSYVQLFSLLVTFNQSENIKFCLKKFLAKLS